MDRTTAAVRVSQREFLSDALPFYRESNFSFALWRLPNTDTVHFAASDQIRKVKEVNMEESEPGFMFAPFDPASEKIFLPAQELAVFKSGTTVSSSAPSFESRRHAYVSSLHKRNYYTSISKPGVSVDEVAYKKLIESARGEVAKGTFEKIVPSRFKIMSLSENFDLLQTFDELCALYPHALVSVFSSPVTGTWVGATPELLASITRDRRFHTVAVAGTQPYNPEINIRNISWTQKEIEEQALVERYVISCFKKIRLREYEEHGPRTSVAGNVIHLKTDFDVDMVATGFPQLGTTMLTLLHPTSAVCGMPLQASLDYIRNNEGYDRQYYSGFLGPLSVDGESCMYVNLRCMQLFESSATLYAGAGVLADSDPDKEWAETEMKMNTLGRIIGK
ncbi:MAG TPA: chorismate-binding protein [Cyclobacteriaceae bacterium]|nr:chorismate-binding protein [Cyclobacteriaceae bacterium]